MKLWYDDERLCRKLANESGVKLPSQLLSVGVYGANAALIISNGFPFKHLHLQQVWSAARWVMPRTS